MFSVTSHLRLSSSLVFFALYLLLFLAGTAAGSQTDQDCAQSRTFYSGGDFKVRQVRIESPFDFMRAMSRTFNELKPQLPLQAGSVFKLDGINEGRGIIEKALDALEEEEDPRSRVRVVLAGYDRCDENTRQVDVYYRIFTTNYNSYLSHTYEIKKDEVERSAASAATTAADTQTKGFLKLQPFATYNRSRQLFAGARAGLRIPGGIVESLELSAGASTKGHDVEFEAAGSRSLKTDALDHLEYRVNFRHSDLPAGANRFRSGILRAQLFGASRPLTSLGVILRYGASLEGGNLQTDLPVTIDSNSRADSGYGGLKAYLGATMRTKNVSMNASYGLQLGTRGATTDIDFVKHIGDFALSSRWLINREPGEFHRAVTLDARVTAGAINTRGLIPVAERFFGGNTEREFIAGDTWQIRSAPFIRSIPENQLNSILIGSIGGTGFYSTNLTFSFPVWGRPLIPAEMAKDPTFPSLLDGQKESARKLLVFRFLNEIPAFGGLVTALGAISEELKELDPFLQDPCIEPEDDEDDPRSELEQSRCRTRDLVVLVQQRVKDKENLPGRLDFMIRARDDEPECVVEETCSELKRLRLELETWEGLLPATSGQAKEIARKIRTSIAARQPDLVTAYNKIDTGPEKQEAERQATEEMKQIEPVIDSFVNELNWFAIGPVAIFDAARIWPDPFGTRYGAGGGIRISLVNFNVTAGYAFNLRRRANEDPGALFFSLDVTDLFR